MRRFTLYTAALLAVLAIGAGSAMAQSQTGTTPNRMGSQSQQMSTQTQSVTGTVVSINDNSMVISKDDGTRMTLMLDTQTNKPSSVNVGDRVRIDFHTMGTNQFHAATITEMSSSSTGTTGQTGASSTYGTENRTTTTGSSSSTYGNESRTGMTGGTSSTMAENRPARHRRGNLPATGSPLAALALLGVAFTGVGALLRRHAHSN